MSAAKYQIRDFAVGGDETKISQFLSCIIAPLSRMTEYHAYTDKKLFLSSILAKFRFCNLFEKENFDQLKSVHKICDKIFLRCFLRNMEFKYCTYSPDALVFLRIFIPIIESLLERFKFL